MDALTLLGLSTIPEEFKDPVEDASGDGKDPSDEVRGRREELEDYVVGKQSSDDEDHVKGIVKKARQLLNREVRVGVEDGRVFVGKLHCLDKQKNIILYDTIEFRSFPGVEAKAAEQRSLGLVLIPARCRTSCYVKCLLEEKLDFLTIKS